jgi:hypothetical protein
MFAVSKPAGNDATEVVMGSWLFPGLGVFFLVLGALDVVAGLATGKIGNVIGPGVFCALAGIIYGFYPIRVVVKADRAADELSRRARSLFRSSDQTEKLSDFASVSIRAGTYYWFFEATRKDGMPLRLFSQMKTGFTWTKVPPADVAARAAQIAEALSLPVGPSRLGPANAVGGCVTIPSPSARSMSRSVSVFAARRLATVRFARMTTTAVRTTNPMVA